MITLNCDRLAAFPGCCNDIEVREKPLFWPAAHKSWILWLVGSRSNHSASCGCLVSRTTTIPISATQPQLFRTSSGEGARRAPSVWPVWRCILFIVDIKSQQEANLRCPGKWLNLGRTFTHAESIHFNCNIGTPPLTPLALLRRETLNAKARLRRKTSGHPRNHAQ